MDNHFLELKNINYSYVKGTNVLRGISFKHPIGKNLSIIGENGSGKTTLLKIMSGLLKASGEVITDLYEAPINKLPSSSLAKLFSYVPQFEETYFAYYVEDIIKMGRYILTKDANSNDSKIVSKLMKELDIYHLRNKLINELSGGEKQKVFLARALAQEAPILLLDEPTNHLDIKYHEELLSYLLRFSNGESRGIPNTLITISHDLRSSYELGDMALLLKNGKMIKYGRRDELFTRDLLKETFDYDIIKKQSLEKEFWDKIN